MKELVLAALGACGAPVPAMPWLHGFAATASTTAATRDAAEQLGGEPDPYGALVLEADVAPDAGDETILASRAQGLVVLNANGDVLGRAPGFDPVGSADDTLALAVGDAGIGQAVIALAIELGGHRLGETHLVLYRVGDNAMHALFDAVGATRDGDAVRTGDVIMFPAGLVYHPPDGGDTSLWLIDDARTRYVRRAVVPAARD